MPIFRDREDAGRQLGELLKSAVGADCPLILGIPTGGGIVAGTIAQQCHWPVDVAVVRRLGLPGNPSVVVGAVAAGGITYLNRALIHAYGITKAAVTKIIEQGLLEIARLEAFTRRIGDAVTADGRTVVLVDDGTSVTPVLRAAIHVTRRQRPARILLAVPVAVPWIWEDCGQNIDLLVSVHAAAADTAPWEWYEEFKRVDLTAIRRAMRMARQPAQPSPSYRMRRE